MPHAYQLRRWIRHRLPALNLGGWVNPHQDADRQVDFLLADDFEAEFYLSQIVSHHHIDLVERFLTTARRLGSLPLLLARRRISGSPIGGIKETQEMLDFCGERNILPEIEMIRMDEINHAFERMEKSDVRYRFVIDMSSLQG